MGGWTLHHGRSLTLKILFWGTPVYAVPTLDALHQAGHTIVGVVTQPDRRRGRGKQLVPSPVKARAEELGLPVFTPERIKRDDACKAELDALGADVSVVVAFGQILPKDVLQQLPLGSWNGHGSLLPRWRGAGPIQWALLEGDQETGVGIMAMEEGLDTGPVLLEQRIPIQLLDSSIALAERLSALTADLMVQAMPLIEAAGPGSEGERLARLNVRVQAAESTYARMLEKQDFELDWSASALSIHRKVMGLHPGAFTQWHGKRLKVLRTEPLIERLQDQLSAEVRNLVGQWPTGGHPPGTILAVIEDLGLVVSSSGCPLLIREAQLEGKARSTAPVLFQQLKATPGDRFGEG